MHPSHGGDTVLDRRETKEEHLGQHHTALDHREAKEEQLGQHHPALDDRETKEEQLGQHHDDTRPQRDKRVTQLFQPKAAHAPSHRARPPSSAKTYDAVHTLAP